VAVDVLLAVGVTLLGLAVGGFLTTLVARVPGGEPLRRPGPSCRTCDAPIAMRDRVPVLSWLLLRGRCRNCGAAIPARYPLIEAATGLLFLLSYLWLGASWELPAALYLAALAITATAIDLEHHRLPDVLVLPSYPVMLALLVLATAGPGGLHDLGRAVLGGVAMFAGYLLLGLINPSGLGGGDIKLAGILGMVLGWVGWWTVAVGAFAGFLIGAVIGLLLLVLGRAGRKSHVPFGPAMFAGTYVGLLFGQDFGQWYWG
jgi:leader peptidase (prepilin peptidase)/N-methyltransferase